MTGFNSKRQATADKLDDDDAQGYIAQFEEALQKEYQRGYDAGAVDAIKEALVPTSTQREVQPQQERQKSGIANSPSDPEICNERSAQACGPVYCGDSGGYCNKCPKQKIIQAVKPCKGMNCGCTDGRSHSLECLAELAAAIAGGMFFPSVYTTPPKRPWVGLSDSQIEQVYYDVAKLHRGAPMPWGQVQFGNALQALVKEKNA